VIIAPSVKNVQTLLTAFQSWVQWSGMTVRLDKCAVFGMKAEGTSYVQFSPTLYLREGMVPVVPQDQEFTYLGRRYCFDFNHEKVRSDLITKLDGLLKTTSAMKIKPQTKIKIMTLYIQGQLLFDLRLYNFPITWIDSHLDSLCTKYLREWLEMPISACIRESANIRKKECGLGVDTIHHLSKKMNLLKRNSLKNSSSEDVVEIWCSTASAKKNKETDDFLCNNTSIGKALKSLKSEIQNKSLNHLLLLPMQGSMSKAIIQSFKTVEIKRWNKRLDRSASCIFNFGRKALLQILPTNATLHRWNRAPDPFCPLCMKNGKSISQTNWHVLSSCGSVSSLERYTQRHNEVLALIVDWLRTVVPADHDVHSDLHAGNTLLVCDLFRGLRPDVAVVSPVRVVALELTMCSELNVARSHNKKSEKYRDLAQHASTLIGQRVISVFYIEVTPLGFVTDLSDFCTFLNIPKMPDTIKDFLTKSALDSSFQIYLNRNCEIRSISDC
jgi:hypothetical protein